jgi:uncharacterized membrane protein YsdA (DUF1294 family)
MRDLVIYLIGINVLTLLIYGIDKWKARRGKWLKNGLKKV